MIGYSIAARALTRDLAVAQTVTAAAPAFYAAVSAIGHYVALRGNRETLGEMREERPSGGRPRVLIEAGSQPLADT